MSVPKSERRQSRAEYAIILQQTEQYFLSVCNDENKKIPYLSEELLKLSIEAYENATLFYEMMYGDIEAETALKKKYCKKTIWTIRLLCSQINIFITSRMEAKKTINEPKQIIIKLLKACNLLQNELKNL